MARLVGVDGEDRDLLAAATLNSPPLAMTSPTGEGGAGPPLAAGVATALDGTLVGLPGADEEGESVAL